MKIFEFCFKLRSSCYDPLEGMLKKVGAKSAGGGELLVYLRNFYPGGIGMVRISKCRLHKSVHSSFEERNCVFVKYCQTLLVLKDTLPIFIAESKDPILFLLEKEYHFFFDCGNQGFTLFRGPGVDPPPPTFLQTFPQISRYFLSLP